LYLHAYLSADITQVVLQMLIVPYKIHGKLARRVGEEIELWPHGVQSVDPGSRITRLLQKILK
jgi:hypothetical protein